MPSTTGHPLTPEVLAHAAESAPTAISITDPSDRILFVNSHFLRLYGYNEEDLPGLDVTHLRASRVAPETALSILPMTLAGGWQGVLWQKRKDGSEFLIELVTSPVRNGSGELIALIGSARDISEETRAAMRRECLSQVAQSVQDASNVARLYADVHRALVAKMGASDVAVFVSSPGGSLEAAYDGSGANAPEAAAMRLALANHVCGTGKAEVSSWIGGAAPAGSAWLAAPLVAEGNRFGALVVRSSRAAFPYDESDIELAQSIASMVAQGIVRHRVEQGRLADLSYKTALMLAVSNAGVGILVLQDGKIVYANAAATAATGYTGQELVEKGSLVAIVHPDEQEQVARRLKRQSATFLVGQTFATTLHHRDGKRVEVQLSVQPFALGGERRYVATMLDVSPLVASGRTDTLTQLPNRQAFDDSLRREWERARRRTGAAPASLALPGSIVKAKKPALLALLLLDLDRFRDLNEQHGAFAGDELLRRTAGALRGRLRAADSLSRLGGALFGAILPETDLAGALATAERLRLAVEYDVFYEVPEGESAEPYRLKMTMSVGVGTVIDVTGTTPTELMRRTDRALMEAKTEGRNRVIAADPLGLAEDDG